jgi:beta-lactam-binding protein with PASTA domain
MKPYLAVAVALAAVGLILSGCGDDSEPAAAPQTVTVIERTVTAEAPAEDVAEEAPPTEEEQTTSPQESSSGVRSGKVTVPNVVGKDHQLAQDTMQAAGLYALEEEDATGQGRVLLFDRNWTVVRQSPKAGTKVSEDQTITLFSKKDGE